MSVSEILLFAVICLATPVIVSYVVEALRRPPLEPTTLSWAPEIPIEHIDIGGNRIRYIRTGKGPNLLLLHTLRTQLDIFQKIIPDLAGRFTVYALDYPGHGYSDIPETRYAPDLFVNTVAGFMDKLDIRDVTLAGVSIGGTIPLLIAARGDSRVERVISINPYDYAAGGGMARSSVIARLTVTLSKVPIVGATFMRLRNRLVERKIFEGGVADPSALPPTFCEELFLVGTRKGHYRAFLNLLNHASGWAEARSEYGKIQIPVLLVYGEQDWSTPEERESTRSLIPGARLETVANGGHFLTLDRPREVIQLILGFAPG